MGLVIPIFISHQGCPHQCLFCNQHAISGADRGRAINDAEIKRTINEWLSRSPGRKEVQVAFYGGSFTCLPREEQVLLLKAVQPYMVEGQVASIRLSTRPDCVNDEIVTLLHKFGVKTVELGVQSLDDKVLRAALRGHSAQESRRAVKTLKKAGIQVGVQLLPGLPGESTTSFLNTVADAITLGPDLIRIYPAVVVRGSALAKMFQDGIYTPLSLNKAIVLTGKARARFQEAGIPVVRMGLQPSEKLEMQLVAGPYHPAFGELVNSRDWFKRIREKLFALKDGQNVVIYISNRDYSAIAGMKRTNIKRFEQLGYKGRFTFIPEKSRERGSIKYVVC